MNRLLGPSAFSGIIIIILLWPLNSILSSRAIKISKSIMAAKDKRMKLLTEIISGIRFVKWFGWEERWIARVMEKREVEIELMIKGMHSISGPFRRWDSG